MGLGVVRGERVRYNNARGFEMRKLLLLHGLCQFIQHFAEEIRLIHAHDVDATLCNLSVQGCVLSVLGPNGVVDGVREPAHHLDVILVCEGN